MCRNLRKLLAGCMMVLLLAGCAAQQAPTAQLLTQAQQDQRQRKMIQVAQDDLERTTNALQSCSVIYARDEAIFCNGLDGYVLQRLDVSNGDVVKEGQTLAWLAVNEDPRMLESLENAV